MDLAVTIPNVVRSFPHRPHPRLHYAYVQSYESYSECFRWARVQTLTQSVVCGDPNTQVYRFGFTNIKDYTNFLLLYSNKIIYAHSSENPAVALDPNTPLQRS
jgi:hypothetical protein